jgi:hypothetical protein
MVNHSSSSRSQGDGPERFFGSRIFWSGVACCVRRMDRDSRAMERLSAFCCRINSVNIRSRKFFLGYAWISCATLRAATIWRHSWTSTGYYLARCLA